MNGVEAAASLFGSEESDSDLFATLGADTTSNQFSPANVFNLDEPSAPHKSNLSSDVQFYSQPETSTFGEYTSPPNHLSSGDNEHAQSNPGDWNEVQKNIDNISHSNEVSPSFDPPPAEVSNQSYTPRPSLPQSNDSYLPPAIPATTNPVTTSSYSLYMPSNPPLPTRIVQEPPMQVSSAQPYNSQHTPPVTTPYLGASSLPVTPNTKPTITRPKYSNAYDPPFIPSSSRRAGRPGGAQQAYNLYQQPSSPYIPATNVSGNYHSQTTPYHAENNHASPEISPNQNYFAQPTYTNNLVSGAANYSGDIALQSQREISSHPSEHLDNTLGYSVNANKDPYTSHRKGEAQHTHYTANSHGAIDLSSSMKVSPPYQESVPTEASSFVNPTPSSVSTPVSQYDLGTSAQADNLNGYVSQHMPPYKREVTGAKDNHDPYTPKVNHGPTNYIPRTSSPLSGFKNESKKPSNTPSNLSAQSSVSSIGVSPAVPMHATRSLNTAIDTSRPTSQRVDLKVGLPDIMKLSNAQYAPSPSLLGSNDPLARTSARAPVVTFGFGGKMVTCFHGMPGLNAGFDVALSSRASSELKVHILHKLLPASALSSPSSSYPGPLLYDSGTPSLSLVRPSLSAQTKAKKTAVVAYLSGRAIEIDQGFGFLSNLEKRAAQGTLILVKLLKIMVENDGRLLGT
jgi:COPII coat assembly protein SEC16